MRGLFPRTHRRAASIAASILLAGACHADDRDGPGPSARPDPHAPYRDTFTVRKADLKPTGSSSLFALIPGAVMTYRDDEGGKLTISVLNETRVVDGVTTRIVEEREESSRGLTEISRNYFAIDPATSDVYYFGEEVDIYKGGVVVGHEGAWLSGEKGARFGLATPGRPVVGDRYHQEVAPGVAMDRAEVVSLDERVETPAGVFEHCVHIEETTPLEKGVGHKWYAPGVGLIRDDEFVLVSRGG